MSDRPVFLYVASYDSLDDAMGDFEAVVELHVAGLVGTFDAAVLRRTANGDFEVLGAPAGLEQLGGVDFDEAVFRRIAQYDVSRGEWRSRNP